MQCENTAIEGDIMSTSSLVHGQKTKLSYQYLAMCVNQLMEAGGIGYDGEGV